MADISRDKWKALLTLSPSIVLIAVFVYGFIGNTIQISLTDWGRGAALSLNPEINYIGFENYIELFTGFIDGRFRQDMVNATFYSVTLLAGAIGLGLFIAILLDRKPRGEDILRTIFLYPMALSFIVSGTIWRWLLAPQGGVNVLPTYFGFEKLSFKWLTSKETIFAFNWQNLLPMLLSLIAAVLIVTGFAYLRSKRKRATKLLATGTLLGLFVAIAGSSLPQALFMEEMHGFNLATIGIIVATVWQYSGYTMALYLAGLHGISQDIADAAQLDGASQAAYYRYVAIPMLKPITISAVIILSHISLKMFDLIFAMTGPDNAATGHPALLMYLTTFRANDFAKGAAIAVVLFLLAAMFIIPYLVSSYRQKRRGY
ncbi:carbohydrate ABC transporter permease [Oleidesulfovibrio sp.]|uniref:carbohydrate ABC transporter permease n=1 Tax=Oleidesulfovibrio sp. TaxID=2909707 RepID=UPI003A8BBA11